MLQHGQVIDLVNGDLEEVELTDSDKLINAQLLDEARKASSESKHKNKLSARRGGSKTTTADNEGNTTKKIQKKNSPGKTLLHHTFHSFCEVQLCFCPGFCRHRGIICIVGSHYGEHIMIFRVHYALLRTFSRGDYSAHVCWYIMIISLNQKRLKKRG